jgi:hypothetical protein
VESLIPVWGSIRSAIYHFQKGNYGWGAFHAAMAVSDVFLAGALVKIGVKAIAKGGAKVVAKEAVGATAKKTASANGHKLGKVGEEIVAKQIEFKKNTTPFKINGRSRIPDFIDVHNLHEVKNVSRLSYTRQLRDFADIAKQEGLRYNLWVRKETRLSKPLRRAIKSENIILRDINTGNIIQL